MRDFTSIPQARADPALGLLARAGCKPQRRGRTDCCPQEKEADPRATMRFDDDDATVVLFPGHPCSLPHEVRPNDSDLPNLDPIGIRREEARRFEPRPAESAVGQLFATLDAGLAEGVDPVPGAGIDGRDL